MEQPMVINPITVDQIIRKHQETKPDVVIIATMKDGEMACDISGLLLPGNVLLLQRIINNVVDKVVKL